MDREDVIDLLTVVSSLDNRQVTKPDVLVWHEFLERYDKDECLDAIMQHFRESTEYLMPSHVMVRVRAKRNDMIDRADPDDRPYMTGLNYTGRRDRYGVIDKSVPDDEDYPSDWSAAQRVKATWEKHQQRRDRDELLRNPRDPQIPASDDVRAQAMEHIRAMLRR